jgi:site-specific DNA-cytosine methylase
MSLGFDLLDSGSVFETVLAVDVEEPMVRVFNANHPHNGGTLPVCRRVDLSDLLNETEVLGFYLDHLATLRGDGELRELLDALPGLGMSAFKAAVGELDARFLREVEETRHSAEYRSALKRIPAGALGQTSVIGFHSALGLPMPSSAAVELPPLVWTDREPATVGSLERVRAGTGLQQCSAELRSTLLRRWNEEVKQLHLRAEGSGRGQLASSAARIRSFVPLVEEPVMRRIRSAWLQWQAERQALRMLMFDERAHPALIDLYRHEDRHVSVVLGGPPCQGFSRIGRGKIRSLREQQVHVQTDPEAGDVRNRLLHKYVLFVSALSPTVFLFENVRHFQAEVQTPEGTYLASEVLAEAIREVSSGGLRYNVANRVVDASKHLVPQTRERFFMVGVRSDAVGGDTPVGDIATWCLSLPEEEPLPARVALDGLPAPIPVSEARANGVGLDQTVQVAPADRFGQEPDARLMCWLRQEPPHKGVSSQLVDAHHVRAPRRDDAELFELFGPGKRWMDYRCDESETLRDLRSMVSALERAVEASRKDPRAQDKAHRALSEVDVDQLKRATEALDGSLSLRLLLETIAPLPGELRHHLITPAYLSKREGKHGDWLARLHADRPSKTIVSHMAKDTYAYIHPFEPRTLSVREAARIQTFPDWYRFGALGLVEAFRVVGNAVPPLLSHHFAERVAQVLQASAIHPQQEAETPVVAARSR